jgi:hypothetical protein
MILFLALFVPLPDIDVPLPLESTADLECCHWGPVTDWTAKTQRGKALLKDFFPEDAVLRPYIGEPDDKKYTIHAWKNRNEIYVDPSQNAHILSKARKLNLTVDSVDNYDSKVTRILPKEPAP